MFIKHDFPIAHHHLPRPLYFPFPSLSPIKEPKHQVYSLAHDHLWEYSAQLGREPGWFISLGLGAWVGLGASLWLRRAPHILKNLQCWLCPFLFWDLSQRALRFLLPSCKLCVCGKVPCNLSRFVLCSRGNLGNENGLFFFFLIKWSHRGSKGAHNDCTVGWQGRQYSLYFWSGLRGLRQCLASSLWLSLGGWAWRHRTEAGGRY